jgi:hypothetical protein
MARILNHRRLPGKSNCAQLTCDKCRRTRRPLHLDDESGVAETPVSLHLHRASEQRQEIRTCSWQKAYGSALDVRLHIRLSADPISVIHEGLSGLTVSTAEETPFGSPCHDSNFTKSGPSF